MKFRKRWKIFPGCVINFSRSGLSATFGPKGFSVNVGKKGTFLNTGIPGTGIYDRIRLDTKPKTNNPSSKTEPAPSQETDQIWFYYGSDGTKYGPVNGLYLKQLVTKGFITQETVLETVDGQLGRAKQIPSLFWVPVPPMAPPTYTAPASPSFCRSCGVVTNPGQVYCLHCGAPVGYVPPTKTAINKRCVAGTLALLLGCVMAQKFYMGSWGWGIVFLISGMLLIIPFFAASIIGIIEGIQFLTMTDEQFAAKYPDSTKAPFRW